MYHQTHAITWVDSDHLKSRKSTLKNLLFAMKSTECAQSAGWNILYKTPAWCSQVLRQAGANLCEGSNLHLSQLMTGLSFCLAASSQYTLNGMHATLKQFHTLCRHTQLSPVWALTPTVTLWHILLLLIQCTFIKCFAPLAPTVITIMQMVKIGRESFAVAASAHSTQGSQPGWDQSSPSCSCLYSWGTVSPNVKLSTKASGS